MFPGFILQIAHSHVPEFIGTAMGFVIRWSLDHLCLDHGVNQRLHTRFGHHREFLDSAFLASVFSESNFP